MSAPALAAITSLQMILFCKTAISLGCNVIISIFQFNLLLEKTHTTKIPFSYLACVILLVNPFILRKGVLAMALWPFLLVRTSNLKSDPVLINHERIHLRQQVEMLVIPFYIWYLTEYLIKYIKFRNHRKAYRGISFEQEAYSNEKDRDYLKKRPFWGFIQYIN